MSTSRKTVSNPNVGARAGAGICPHTRGSRILQYLTCTGDVAGHSDDCDVIFRLAGGWVDVGEMNHFGGEATKNGRANATFRAKADDSIGGI